MSTFKAPHYPMIIYVISIGISLTFAFEQCDPNYNSSFEEQTCMLLPGFEKHQLATCLTSKDVASRSVEGTGCSNPNSQYCYLPCMNEKNNVTFGDVYIDCACSKHQESTEAPILPVTCYDPPGLDCSWYQNCLEASHPCNGSAYDYADGFALRYCEAFSASKDTYSPSGQLWVNATRKCLQVALVPVLQIAGSIDCKTIQLDALKTHSTCYLQPGDGAPSFCDLDFSDMLKIFWTIKSAFIDLPEDVFEEGFSILKGCISNRIIR